MDNLAIIISILGSIISGVVLLFVKRFFQSRDQKDEERRRDAQKESILILKSIDAVGKLTYANAVAIRDGKTNGEMKQGVDAYHSVQDEMYSYLLEQNAKK